MSTASEPIRGQVDPGVLERVEFALAAWDEFGPRVHRSIATFSVFEVWNLLVILISLGGFVHVHALTCAAWAEWLLWFIAIATVVVSGVSVFVWLKRD